MDFGYMDLSNVGSLEAGANLHQWGFRNLHFTNLASLYQCANLPQTRDERERKQLGSQGSMKATFSSFRILCSFICRINI